MPKYTKLEALDFVLVVRDNEDGTTTSLTPNQTIDELNELTTKIILMAGAIRQLEADIDELEGKQA